ncbi:MAG: hypothetical protein BVN33_09115 [Proteobacteria bacterium ST_bin13]|nr:MAG: hypothetical protein BVN33_09115 [Proteobacteria bacterium ST_bin13]
MNSMLKKVGLGFALAATALTAAVPADAQRYGGGFRGDGFRGGGFRGDGFRGDGFGRGRGNGGAVIAGIAGLAIGAAIASNRNDRFRDRYYLDRGYPVNYDYNYYNDHGYYPDDGYYAYNYRPRFNRCRVVRQWDPYYQESVRIRICR